MKKELLIKYLNNKCSETELSEVLSWINSDALNEEGKKWIFDDWNSLQETDNLEEDENFTAIFDKIQKKIDNNTQENNRKANKNLSLPSITRWITRAAAILLLPVLSLFLYTNLSVREHYTSNLNELEVEAPAGSRMHLELGDGTKVFLNHGSKLKYPYRFEGENRKVFLTGEAYFEVAHNTKIPFIVGTNRLDVKATGTAFNVSAYLDDDAVETTLVEGKVILYERKNNSEIKALIPGESLKFDAKKSSYSLEKGNTLKYTAWKDGLLVFKNDYVEDIAKKLARWYNIDVEISNQKMKEYPFTATFSDETLPQVLELLSLATPVSYQLTLSKKLPDGSFSKQKVLIGLKTKEIKH